MGPPQRAWLMLRESKLLGGLIDWITGGISARLDFVERDVETLQGKTERIAQDQEGMAQVVMAHHQQLERHQAQLQVQAAQMVAMRRMHGMLAKRLGEPFPGKTCEVCGGGMIFNRVASENSYSLECPKGCGQRLLLPEGIILNSLKQLPAAGSS